MMFQALLGPLGSLASTWLSSKVETKAAETRMKVSEADARAKIMLSAATSEADWERIMAQGTQNSWKDEWITLLFSIPLILAFCGDWGNQIVQAGFTALEVMPTWYQYSLGGIVSASIGMRSVSKFFGK